MLPPSECDPFALGWAPLYLYKLFCTDLKIKQQAMYMTLKINNSKEKVWE